MSTRLSKKKTNLFHSDVETCKTAPVIMCTLPNNDHRSSMRSDFIFVIQDVSKIYRIQSVKYLFYEKN